MFWIVSLPRSPLIDALLQFHDPPVPAVGDHASGLGPHASCERLSPLAIFIAMPWYDHVSARSLDLQFGEFGKDARDRRIVERMDRNCHPIGDGVWVAMADRRATPVMDDSRVAE
jgi:hypothetical protein